MTLHDITYPTSHVFIFVVWCFVLLTDFKCVKVERFAEGIDDGARRARGPQVRHAGPTGLESGAITVLSNGAAQGIRPPLCHAYL